MASLMAGLASQLPGAHLDEGPLAPVGELDPVTGLFYNPSSSKMLFTYCTLICYFYVF